MPRFSHSGFDFEYIDQGTGDPVLLIHGFASNMDVNWISTGWMKTLVEAGHRVVAFDNRGHGASSKSHASADYYPELMAGDAVELLDHLAITRAHVMGYSMGARVSAFLALQSRERVGALVFGGLGMGMIDGVGDWDPIAEALLAENPAAITNVRGQAFRTFADQTKSDRHALAACIETSRKLLPRARVAEIAAPTLIAVGTRDDIAGDGAGLARILPNATHFTIDGRDHMLAVGDKTFKKRVVEFLGEHPLERTD